jgi:chorismate synthase
MSSVWGNNIRISLFGESHSELIGITVDGLEAGHKIDTDEIKIQMRRRMPGSSQLSTSRKENDDVKIISGLNAGYTTGMPLTALICNEDVRKKDYSEIQYRPRPGHADITAFMKYGGFCDMSGGGHFSGRLTAPLVFAGAVCRQILSERGILIGGHVLKIGNAEDEHFDPLKPEAELIKKMSGEYFPVISMESKDRMVTEIEKTASEKDSIGGIIECKCIGIPFGIGEPIFGNVESRLSSIIFGIPAVKGIEFGSGFSGSMNNGSENNDEPYYDTEKNIRFRSNNSGGILGGITDGMPVIFRTAFKPTPSIGIEQNTVDLKEEKNCRIKISGRHDPCIAVRAVPAVESACAVAFLDMLKEGNMKI